MVQLHQQYSHATCGHQGVSCAATGFEQYKAYCKKMTVCVYKAAKFSDCSCTGRILQRQPDNGLNLPPHQFPVISGTCADMF